MKKVTVTGIDERCDLKEVAKLQAEIGILYTQTPEGRNRYPSQKWILNALEQLPRTALHICGSQARHALANRGLYEMTKMAGRVQVNGSLTCIEAEKLCDILAPQQVIFQFKPHMAFINSPNVAFLVDASGGRGISPESWPRLDVKCPVGFAGGLGPDNLKTELPRINQKAALGWWVDMEGKLRVDDWFSIDKAQQVISIFYEYFE